MPDRPTPGQIEERQLDVTTDGRRLRGLIPFGTESRDLGGFREVIEPGALRGARLDDLVCTVDHSGVPIGRHPRTLDLEERADGLHWSVEPPRSRQDVIEAVERGDLRGGSWRMRVARDRWQGDVRHVEAIAELRDVSVVTHPSYDTAAVELRSEPTQEATVPENTETVAAATETPESAVEPTETRNDPQDTPTPPPAAGGSLHVQDRVTVGAPRNLADEFRSRGFPAERATMPWDEFEARAVTWSGGIDNLNTQRRQGGPLGADQRYAWPAFGRVGVGADVTSISVFTQTARSAPSGMNVVRDIDETSPKPETGSTLDVVVCPLKQVATVQTGIPNIYLQQPQFDQVVQNDLRLSLNEGLDGIVLAEVAKSGFQAPSSDPLIVSIRTAIETIQAAGYAPDTLILDPTSATALDTLVADSSTEFYLFQPGAYSPSIFGLTRRISKSAPAPVVVDSAAFGRMYATGVSLGRYEENAGSTNTSTVRMELNAAFGVERQDAAVRIAAS